jgi:O-antigen/teichoic acid export membrane protein
VATSDSLGIYVVAVTYASVLLTIPGSAALVMLPRMVNAHRDGTARACLERWYRRMLWVTVAAAGVLAMSSVVMIPALFGSAFAGATRIAVLLAPATVMLGLNQVLSTAFRGIGRPEIASAAEIVGVAATVAGLLLLLPRYGTYGAAGASLIAYSASHVYLARQAVIVFGTDLRSLSLPTHADREALRMAGARTRQFLDAR